MNRFYPTILFLFILVSAAAAQGHTDYPPKGWIDNITEATARAESEDRLILLYFAGSDWCSWCMRLKSELFLTKEFTDWAEENAVLVLLDFPQNIEQDPKIQRQNAAFAEIFNVEGFPTIWLLDSDLTPLLKTGYRDLDPAAYVSHLESERMDWDERTIENFKKLFHQVKDYIENS